MKYLIALFLLAPLLAYADCAIVEFPEANTYDLPELCELHKSSEIVKFREQREHRQFEHERTMREMKRGVRFSDIQQVPEPAELNCAANIGLARRLIDKKFPFDPESPPCGWFSKSKSDEIRKKWAEEEKARRNKP